MILVLMQLSFILMGTFLDDTAMLVIVAPLYVPLVGALGYDLIWYGVLYTITTQIAYMTPPFGYNLFLMRAMAPPFRAMQSGTIDAVQSDDDSMASPTEVTVFGGYFPFASRYSLDVPVLFNRYGLNEIWDAEYAKVGVKHISAGAWDPCHFATKDPINSLADLQGKRVFTFPTAGRFLSQFGVVPVTLPWEDIEVAVQTGELDGIAWSGITEDYTVGWADVTNYFLTNNISGAWIGHFFANMGRWEELPDNLKELMRVCFDASHYYRQHWYWGGEAALRVNGTKMALTSIPDAEWAQVEAAARVFWDEIAAESETKARVVEIFKQYNADMEKAGRPYRYS
jgi:TRAP-type mannitol/chloroaromatic compound transport system substrate-binding protein